MPWPPGAWASRMGGENMPDMFWLLAANVAVWVGLGAYLVFLDHVRRGLEQRLRHMETIDDA